MDNKKIMIIGIIILIIAAGILFVVLTSQNYERIEITPNGTSIEVPLNKTKYDGEVESAKVWHWDKGLLVTYNSYADDNIVKVTEIGFDTVNEVIETGENQTIDGLTCYVINADEILNIELFDIVKVNYNGKFYCIPLANETTHDNIIILSTDQDAAVHMANSVQYKNVYLVDAGLNTTISAVENVTTDLINNTNLNDVKSSIENETGINLDNAKAGIEQISEKLPI